MEKSDKFSYIILSHPLSVDTPSYGNRDSVNIIPKSRIEDGETANTSTWTLTNNHIGTHIDVPKHFYTDGKTLTDIEPHEWVFNKVSFINIALEKGKLISEKDLDFNSIHDDTELLLIRTGFEQKRSDDVYWNGYPGLNPDMCRILRSKFKKLRGIGFDFISLTSPLFKEAGKEAHRILLEEKNGDFVFIIEDMKLSTLATSPEKVIILPTLVEKGNGGPVTALALSFL
jgi:kynurenine formamidase